MSEYDTQAGRDMPSESERTAAQAKTEDEDLHDALGSLAALVTGGKSVDELLEQVAEFATVSIPGADGAGVTLLRAAPVAQRIQTCSAKAPWVQQLNEIQYDRLHEGPCLTCMETGRAVVSGSLGSDARWPRFGPRAARLGVRSALSLPLMLGDEVIGAINSYAHEHDAFTDHAVRLGRQFAGPAAVSVRNTQLLVAARDKAEQLQTALTSRATIDQAIGIVRSRTGGSAQEAFDRLRRISQQENVKLAAVAERIVDESVRRARARHARADESSA